MGRVIASAVIAGLIGAGTALIAVAQEATALADISGLTWIIIGVGGTLIVLKDVRTYLAAPPPTATKR